MTGCDVAQRLVSDALDDPLDASDRAVVDAHLDSCSGCRRFADDLSSLRRRLRVSPVADVPDIAGAVRSRLESAAHRSDGVSQEGAGSAPGRPVARAAGVLVPALLVGALVAGLFGPQVGVAETLGERMLRSQVAIESLSVDLSVTEHGWHPDVGDRRFSGRLVYASPDRISLDVEDRTDYPEGGWQPNDVTVAMDSDRIIRRGPAPCPVEAQPSCNPSRARLEIVEDPEPFSAPNVAPLDLVVPTGSFGTDEPVATIENHPVDGRPTVGVEVTASQVAGLLNTLLGTGNWRQIHPTDRVRLWLDRQWLVPLEIEVLAAGGLERTRWASVNGYRDETGRPILHVVMGDLDINGGASPEAPTVSDEADQLTDGDFRPNPPDEVTVPPPGWLPRGMRPHASGIVGGDIHVRTWTDGRAWLKIRATASWDGQRMFGRVGPVVRRSDVDGSVLYTSADGSTVGLHGELLDVAVSGSLPATDLQRVAASLPVIGTPVPAGWVEGATLDLDAAERIVPALLVPPADLRFHHPAVRRIDGGVTMTVAGSGNRGYELLQLRDEEPTPPMGADVLVVAVRDTSGRYTAATGELEWVEDGRAVILRSRSMSLAELITTADALRPRR